jgi:hypothetical protein
MIIVVDDPGMRGGIVGVLQDVADVSIKVERLAWVIMKWITGYCSND